MTNMDVIIDDIISDTTELVSVSLIPVKETVEIGNVINTFESKSDQLSVKHITESKGDYFVVSRNTINAETI